MSVLPAHLCLACIIMSVKASLSALTVLPWVFFYVCLICDGDWRSSFSVGGWRSGVLCQHPSSSPRLLLLLQLPPAWVRSMSCDRQLDQSPPWSKASYWRMCSHAYSIAERNVLWYSGRNKRVPQPCKVRGIMPECVFVFILLCFFVNTSHHCSGSSALIEGSVFCKPSPWC